MSAAAAGRRIGIIGAGVIGLSLGWTLARRGFVVRLFDAKTNEPAGSPAAAGLLAPISEFLAGSPVRPETEGFAAAWASLTLWREWAGLLGDIGWRDSGALHLGSDAADAERLSALAAAALDHGAAARLLSGAERRAFLGAGLLRNGAAPAAGQATAEGTALCLPEEAELHPRAALRALAAAFGEAGGAICTTGPAEPFLHAHKAAGVHFSAPEGTAATEHWECDHVVIAAGAASRRFSALDPRLAAITPIKGQIGLYAAPSPPPRGTLRFPGGYLAAKSDGVMMLGASMEPGRTDGALDSAVLDEFEARLRRAAPDLGPLGRRHGAQAGLRAGSQTGVPLVGPLDIAGLWVAAGHGRNGWLLAPQTARTLADQIEAA